ncbi:MAG: ATPase, T2SS/T4P/T4SS family [Candidatus Aenigmatarchaeota archaeon]
MKELINIFSSFLEKETVEDVIYDSENNKVKVYDSKFGYSEIDFQIDEEKLQSILTTLSIDLEKTKHGSFYFDNLRITVVLPPLTRKISIAIRKFRKVPISIFEMIENGTITKSALAYLWIFVDGLKLKPANIIIAGQPGSGKTSFLNMLSLFINKEERIVSVEDVYELRLPLTNWLPILKRDVDLKEINNIIYRVRPDRLIYGEIRNKEDAEIFFNFIGGGLNGCISTSFALKSFDLINRLTTEPFSINPGLVRNLDLIIIMRRSENRKYVYEISEVASFEYGKPTINNLFFHDGNELKFTNTKVYFFEKLHKYFNISMEKIKEELIKREKKIEYIIENRLTNFEEVYKFIHE